MKTRVVDLRARLGAGLAPLPFLCCELLRAEGARPAQRFSHPCLAFHSAAQAARGLPLGHRQRARCSARLAAALRFGRCRAQLPLAREERCLFRQPLLFVGLAGVLGSMPRTELHARQDLRQESALCCELRRPFLHYAKS